MSDLLRPTFQWVAPLGPEEAASRLDALYRQGFEGQSVRTHLLITVPRRERRIWSPWLHVDLRPVDGNTRATDVFARFSPAPSVWTGFMLAALALVTIALFSGLGVLAQRMANERPTAVWGVVVPLTLVALMLWASRAAQTLARDQMATLRAAVMDALGPGAA